MKTYTYGQIQIVRDALELAHDTSEGEINRKIRGAIELLDTPLDAFEEVYRLNDEVKRLTAELDALKAGGGSGGSHQTVCSSGGTAGGMVKGAVTSVGYAVVPDTNGPGLIRGHIDRQGKYYPEGPMQAVYQAGRDSMKAECVKVCEKWHDSLASEPEMLEIAEEIRELK